MASLRTTWRWLPVGLLAAFQVAWAGETIPPCFGPDNYATQAALAALVNTGRVTDASAFYRDDETPYGLKTELLDAERIGRHAGPGLAETDVYRQIQKIVVHTRSGTAFSMITISETSRAECAMAAPTVVLLSPQYAALQVGTSVLESGRSQASSKGHRP
ncbi:hypothetical protein G3580_18025 [Nitrogeniibacter mangrovi]|uniref:Uncharacterized protein n=1 Tax=Nitrogeniibacter mangrovi TaxID=2016596 RepID=A0A6C1B6I2_9RHOO|nr:hypothetical protein [Nitrogeniibacter mangrovi]QID19346.1 hypothetical protein G3580_18025 [Nitrogeniibacter mangrovi]